jgi:hypothetical protein
MFEDDHDDLKVVQESISGDREVDESTFSSVAVLAERLEALKRSGSDFEGIEFSPHMEELALCEMISAIS